MWIFKRRQAPEQSKETSEANGSAVVKFDASILRKNDITRLSLDERWTKLFVTTSMSPELDTAEKEMGELIKREALLKNEQENLEPQKRKCMSEIMNLTQKAFDNNDDEAKKKLTEYKNEIEKTNSRMDAVMEEIETLDEKLKEANLKLLEDSVSYIFSTLKFSKERTLEIQKELAEMEQRGKALREELETISVDWTQYALDLTELIGADEVKRLESEFGLEGDIHEAIDATTDEIR